MKARKKTAKKPKQEHMSEWYRRFKREWTERASKNAVDYALGQGHYGGY